MVNKSIPYYIFCAVIAFILSCQSKQYPCPAYNSSSNIKMDTTGAISGRSVNNKDKKTGLVKKKNSKSMYDRKSHVRVF